MHRSLAVIVRRLACLGLVAVVLAGCAASTASYDDQATPRRCNRNGDVDERKAC